MNILTLDIETTGLPPKGAHYEADYNSFPRIVKMGWKINDGETLSYLINIEGFPIESEAMSKHGITDEMSAASPHMLPVVLNNFIPTAKEADKIVGFGMYFDTSTIKANVLRLCGGDLEKQAYKKITEILHKDKRIDLMYKSNKFCGLGKWPKLIELHEKLFNEYFNAHDNKSDVEATYRCYNELVKIGVI